MRSFDLARYALASLLLAGCSSSQPSAPEGHSEEDKIHVGGAAMNIATLDVADELLLQRTHVEEGVRLLGQIVALLFLGADIHQADRRLRTLENVLCNDAAHHAVLKEMLRLGADVCPDVEQHARIRAELVAGDRAGARRAMTDHIAHAGRLLVEHLDGRRFWE